MLKHLRWIIVLLIFIVYMINYFDRVALSITLPMIEHDLHLNAEQFGIIFGSFFFGYAIFNFIGGLASDKFGGVVVLGVTVILWSLFCGLTAAASGFFSMIILRILFGMAEGPICASSNKIINGWFPKKKAATAVGLLSAGSPLGGAVSGPLVGMLALNFGWRLSFVVICVIGIIWSIIWLLLSADSPLRSRFATKEEQQRIEMEKAQEEEEMTMDHGAQTDAQSLLTYIRQPIILATAFAFFSYNYILFFFLSWFPTYLVQGQGLDIKSMSFTTVIPWIVGFIGLALGGYLSDFIFKSTGKLFFSRKIILVVCLLCSAIGVGLAGIVDGVMPAVLLMSFSIFFLYLTGAIYWAIIQDVVHKNKVGSASGFIHLIGSISGIIGPIITGFIVQNTGSFTGAFVLAGLIAVVGAILAFIFIRAPKHNRKSGIKHTVTTP